MSKPIKIPKTAKRRMNEIIQYWKTESDKYSGFAAGWSGYNNREGKPNIEMATKCMARSETINDFIRHLRDSFEL